MSKSIQQMVDIFNPKNKGEKNILNQKEKTTDNFTTKMAKMMNNKNNDINKIVDKKNSVPIKSNNNINSSNKVNNNVNKNTKKEKEDKKIGLKQETILAQLKKEHSPIVQEKKLSFESKPKQIFNKPYFITFTTR